MLVCEGITSATDLDLLRHMDEASLEAIGKSLRDRGFTMFEYKKFREVVRSPDTSLGSNPSPRKSRPQAAFYPNINATNKPQKPFSRSAAKRESVMALGSIEHLQHYFTKTGIAAKKESNSQRKGLVPALGGAQSHIKSNPSLASLAEIDLPPSPALPAMPQASMPYVRTFEVDPENLRPGVIDDLAVVERMWSLQSPDVQAPTPEPGLLGGDIRRSSADFDVLGVLKSTTRVVRSVRNYLLSLPDESAIGDRHHFRPTTLSSGTPQKRLVSQPNDPSNPLSLIRRSALEVLTMLRALEESSRIPLSDDAYDAQSDHASVGGGSHGGPSRVASPFELSDGNDDGDSSFADTSFAFSLMQVPGRHGSVLVWEEEEDEFRQDSDEERGPREHWDERLVLGSGWLYKKDVKLESVSQERAVIGRYLDAVDDILFGGRRDGTRGWERERDKLARREQIERDGRLKGRRASAPPTSKHPDDEFTVSTRRGRRVVSTGMLDSMHSLVVTEEPEEMPSVSEEDETESVDDEDLPEWAKRASFKDDLQSRTRALLSSLLPPTLLPLLPPAGDREQLLQVLSSGQLLCVAYNTGVRRSRKPWGYISKDGIHDIVALEAARAAGEHADMGQKAWTFRRTDNLRLWAAALKIRYMLPIVVPAAPVTDLLPPSGGEHGHGHAHAHAPSTVKFPHDERPIHFDARVVARRDEGWEEMLEGALERWVRAVVDERRGDIR
ncbi:hypothetical protein OF83DRAFT_1165174 [Amylostereum chailletii]|nr:hypothetical protein OF83DRAFT_1165174 [Amylostereum chailletii]